MDDPILIKAGSSTWELDRQLLDRADYFSIQLSGRHRLNQIDNKILFTFGEEWETSLSNYIYFLKHRRVKTRITGDDYALALYVSDQDYLQRCDEAPRISNRLMKMLRHNHKAKRLWSRFDEKNQTRRLYFSELSDAEFDLIVNNWPTEANHLDAAQEWVARRGIEQLPKLFFKSPGLGVLQKLAYSSVWAYWLIQSLDEAERTRRTKQRYPAVFIFLQQSIREQTQKMIWIPRTLDLVTLWSRPVDDTWLYQAVQYIRLNFILCQPIKTYPTRELKARAECLSVLAKKLYTIGA